MVNIFGMNLFGCSICNGRHHKMGKHLMMKKTMKQKKYRGGYTYNNKNSDKSIAGEDVTNSTINSRRQTRSQSSSQITNSENGRGLSKNYKTHNKSHKRRHSN
jgi:hypothetical protein